MNLVYNHPHAEIAEITPAIAKQLLSTSIGNRKLRKDHVERLAGAMKRGEWRITTNAIGIDVNGNLRDAHHRLNAVVMSGVTIKSLIVFGMPVNAYEVIDTGALRSYSDRLNKDKRATDVYRLAFGYLTGISSPSVDQLRPLVESEFGKIVLDLIEYCGTSMRFYSSAGVKLSVCLLAYLGYDREYLFEQYRAMVLLDFDSMSKSTLSIVKHIETNNITAKNAIDGFAKTLKMLNPENKELSKMSVMDRSIAVEILQNALSEVIK